MGRLKRGTPPTYRRHRVTGQALVTINGRDIYLGKYDTPESKAQYARLIAEYAVTGAIARETADADSPTVMEVLAAFLRHAQVWYIKNGKPTKELDAYRLILRDVKSLYGDDLASDFGPLAFRSLRQVWIDRGQSRPTVNKNAGRAKRIFKWAVSQELVPASVYQSLATVDGLRKGRCSCREPDPILPVALDVVERTLPFLPPVTADMVRFQLLTGARPGEVCTLTPDDVDRSKDVWEYRVGGHKTEHHGRSRTIYIGPEAKAVLTPYLLRPGNAVCFSMAESLEQRRQMRSDLRKTPLSCGNRRGKRSGIGLSLEKPSKQSQIAFNTVSYCRAIYHACDTAFPAEPPLGQTDGESMNARLRRLSESQQGALKAIDAHFDKAISALNGL